MYLSLSLLEHSIVSLTKSLWCGRPERHITVGNQPSKNRKCGYILIQSGGVEFIHRIISRVVQVKVIATILMQTQRGYPCGN